MRVLNNEEIEDVLGCWCGQMHEYKAVAKAQHQQDLRDFIEWGDGQCPHKYHEYLTDAGKVYTTVHYARRLDCEECWESLKQLVGL